MRKMTNTEGLELFRQRVEKRCASDIAKLRQANNMVTVEGVIREATQRFFGLNNLGILKLQMRHAGKIDDFPAIAVEREESKRKKERHLIEQLLESIPKRLHTSEMYKRLLLRVSEAPKHDFSE